MPLLSYTVADFTAYTKAKSADVNSRFSDIKTLLNTTKLDSTNVQQYGLTRDRMAAGTVSTGSIDAVVVNDTSGHFTDKSSGLNLSSPNLTTPAVTDQLVFTDQGADPASPTSGKTSLYTKNSNLYYKTAAGVVSQVGSGTTSGVQYDSNSNFEVDISGYCGAAAGATSVNLYTYALAATFTNGSANITCTGHGLILGDRLQFTTTGALPTNFAASTTYYVVSVVDANTITVSASLGGSAISAGSAGTGTHTMRPLQPTNATTGTGSTLFARVTSGQLRGSASGQIQKPASNVLGEALVYPFTIDVADKAKVLSIEFDYNAPSAFVASSGQTGSDSDIEVFIYDVTNAVRIPVSPAVLTANGSNNYTFKGTFQTASNSVSYKLIWHFAGNNGNSYNFTMDGISVGPQTILQGPPVTDEIAYTPTFTGLGTVGTTNFTYRRVGDCLHVEGNVTSGTVAASLASVSLPPGLSIDTTKIALANTTAAAGRAVGDWSVASTATAFGEMVTALGTSSTVVYFGGATAAGTGLVPQNGSAALASSSLISIKFVVPIAGWSSTTVMSNGADTRVVALSATGSYTGGTGAGIAAIFPTVTYDTHGGYNATTGQYTVPVSGYYKVTAFLNTFSNSNVFAAYVNGTKRANLGITMPSANGYGSGSAEIQCNAGDIITVCPTTTSFGAAQGSDNYLSIERLSGPSAISATEVVAASYYVSANVTPGDNAQVNFDTKLFDTHNAVTTGASWKFTAPTEGKYHVSLSSICSISGGGANYLIYKNGSAFAYLATMNTSLAAGSGSIIVQLAAGDYIDIRVNTATVTITGTGAPYSSHVNISRLVS